MQITEKDGLVFGCLLDGAGGATDVDWAGVRAWKEGDAPMWVHLDRRSQTVRDWLQKESGLTEVTISALLAEETRPRIFRGKRGLVAILRGINTNPDEAPLDLVSIRMWCDGHRVITLRSRKLKTPRDVLEQLKVHAEGPKSASELFSRLIVRLTERMADAVSQFEDQLDQIEEELDIQHASSVRSRLSRLRQDAVHFRRYMAPQREAMSGLVMEPASWLDDQSRLHMREAGDRLARYVEEIDAARERSIVLKDDIANQIAEQSNKTLYLLALISAIFLPLSFFTGMFGINVGGVPGVENPLGFALFSLAMIVLLAIELWLIRKLKWL